MYIYIYIQIYIYIFIFLNPFAGLNALAQAHLAGGVTVFGPFGGQKRANRVQQGLITRRTDYKIFQKKIDPIVLPLNVKFGLFRLQIRILHGQLYI